MELNQNAIMEQIKMVNDLYIKGIEEGKRIGRAEACQEFAKDLNAMKELIDKLAQPCRLVGSPVVKKDVERTDEPKEMKG